MPRATLDMFMHHPLFVTLQMEPELTWECRVPVPDKDEYDLVAPVETYLSAMPLGLQNTLMQTTESNMIRWLLRRAITVHGVGTGVMDMRGKRLYKVDMVAERGGVLTLILVYFSLRHGGAQWDSMLEYGAAVRAVLIEQWRLDGDVIVLNFSAGGRVRGAIIES